MSDEHSKAVSASTLKDNPRALTSTAAELTRALAKLGYKVAEDTVRKYLGMKNEFGRVGTDNVMYARSVCTPTHKIAGW